VIAARVVDDIHGRREIVRRIPTTASISNFSDAWKLGEKIPVFEQLVAEFGVAQATVRQALGLLASEGLIDSRPGRGTVVVRAPRRALWMNLSNS